MMELGEGGIDMKAGVNNTQVGATMARHLLDRGYRRIAYLGTGTTHDYRAMQRYEGHRQVLREAGGESELLFQHDEPPSYDVGRQLFLEAWEACSELEALHFANDNLAAGAILEANRRGIHVPEDIAIGGYLGLSLSDHLAPRLTTVAVPRCERGVAAARVLLMRLEDQPSTYRDIGYQLMV